MGTVMTAQKQSFRAFVDRIEPGDSLTEAFRAHVAAKGCPDSIRWGEIRYQIRNAGADDLAVIGARLAWRAFKQR